MLPAEAPCCAGQHPCPDHRPTATTHNARARHTDVKQVFAGGVSLFFVRVHRGSSVRTARTRSAPFPARAVAVRYSNRSLGNRRKTRWSFGELAMSRFPACLPQTPFTAVRQRPGTHAGGVRMPWASAAQNCKELGKRHGGDTDGGVSDAVRQHQGVGVDQCAAGVDNVGHVAVLFVRSRAQERLG